MKNLTKLIKMNDIEEMLYEQDLYKVNKMKRKPRQLKNKRRKNNRETMSLDKIKESLGR